MIAAWRGPISGETRRPRRRAIRTPASPAVSRRPAADPSARRRILHRRDCPGNDRRPGHARARLGLIWHRPSPAPMTAMPMAWFSRSPCRANSARLSRPFRAIHRGRRTCLFNVSCSIARPLFWHRLMRHYPCWETPLAKFYRATDPREVETTRASAQLPGLDITILHRQSPHEGTEEISIHLRAHPTFAALHRSMEIWHPWAIWLEASRLVWAPWLAATQLLLGAGHARPLARAQPPARSGQG